MMSFCSARSRRKGLHVRRTLDSAGLAAHEACGRPGLIGGCERLKRRRVGRRRDAGESREAEDFGMTAEAKLANALDQLEVGLRKLDADGFHGIAEAA